MRAKMAASGDICPDGSMEAAKTAEEGSQSQPEPGPSGGRGGYAEVKAQTGKTRNAATAHLLSDDQESEETYVIIKAGVKGNDSLAIDNNWGTP
jgi:hypothetical protein